MGCECKVGPGKFEGESALVFMAWHHVMLGNVDATTGDTDWLRAPLNVDTDGAADAAKAYGYCDACVREAIEDDCAGGLKLWESNDGFVCSRYYATRTAFDKALDKAEAEEEANDDKQ